MPPAKTPEELNAAVDAALAQRLRGNEAFKKEDYATALREYHGVLLALRGLDSVNSIFPMGGSPTDEEPEPAADAEKKDGEPEFVKEPEVVKEPTTKEKVKTALALTYLNMSAVQLKNKKFKRALECTQEALKIDENNAKAKYREAQARIGLGELSKGKAILEELQKKSPDVAIEKELKALTLADKAGEAKKSAAFRGMYDRKPKTTTTTTAPPTATPPPPPAPIASPSPSTS